MKQSQLPIVIAGHVDHGKSSLIGRLLYDTGSLPEGKYEELRAVCDRRGVPLEWSFVLDSFQAERDQAITIDTTQIWFATENRDYVIIDAPGHREFLKNMLSGAAQAQAAVLVIDATEGLQEQTRRHAYLLHMLDVSPVIVVINKMDAAGYAQETFDRLAQEAHAYLDDLGLSVAAMIPISAREGDLIAERGPNMEWFQGPTLLAALDTLRPARRAEERPFRMAVQDVYRDGMDRILVGRIASGEVHVGDRVVISPSDETAHIAEIAVWSENQPPDTAMAGQAIGLKMKEKVFAERGMVISHDGEEEGQLPTINDVFQLRLFWFAHKALGKGDRVSLKIGTAEVPARVQSIDALFDLESLGSSPGREVSRNGVAEATFRLDRPIAVDSHSTEPGFGRAVIYQGADIAGAGLIDTSHYPDQRQRRKASNVYTVAHFLDAETRARQIGHRGGVFWLTGLSGAGKSTLAMAAERALFERGYHVFVLDGENVRRGLNEDLGFSPEDRSENIRRVGEVAALMAEAGLVVLTAFISPYQSDRDKARTACAKALGENAFHEIHIKADLTVCEDRDPKGLYKRARSGEIKEFTGISAPYEPPLSAEYAIDTSVRDVEISLKELLDYIESRVAKTDPQPAQIQPRTIRA